jgi:endosialidase-like protein
VLGDDALFSLTTGSNNTAVGFTALHNDTTGGDNTAIGYIALSNNTTGFNNTAAGYNALLFNTTGFYNTATGGLALQNNTIGNFNTAIGVGALQVNVTGNNNTATAGLGHNTTGSNNTATGFLALDSNTTGNNNTADGYNALINNTTGSFNIAVGNNAGANLTTGKNNIDIGNNGVAGESKTIRIGKQGTQTNTYFAGISGVTVPTGVPVIVDSTGHLGTTTSSARFKEAIKPMAKTSETLYFLEPVTFRYKRELDPDNIPQFGLVAEEVEKVNPDLVARDDQGKPYTVRYEAVNAMLLNEFLKEHRKVQEQEATITELKKDFRATVAQLTSRLNEQAAQIQKVSGQLEASKPAPQVVKNP